MLDGGLEPSCHESICNHIKHEYKFYVITSDFQTITASSQEISNSKNRLNCPGQPEIACVHTTCPTIYIYIFYRCNSCLSCLFAMFVPTHHWIPHMYVSLLPWQRVVITVNITIVTVLSKHVIWGTNNNKSGINFTWKEFDEEFDTKNRQLGHG